MQILFQDICKGAPCDKDCVAVHEDLRCPPIKCDVFAYDCTYIL